MNRATPTRLARSLLIAATTLTGCADDPPSQREMARAARDALGDLWSAVEPALRRAEDRVRDDVVPGAGEAARQAAADAARLAGEAADAARDAVPEFQPIPGLGRSIACDQAVCRIEVELIRSLGSQRDALWTHAQLVPNLTARGVQGLRLVNVHPQGIFAAVGLASGDVVERVEGVPVSSPGEVLALRDRLRGKNEITITIRGPSGSRELTLRAVTDLEPGLGPRVP